MPMALKKSLLACDYLDCEISVRRRGDDAAACELQICPRRNSTAVQIGKSIPRLSFRRSNRLSGDNNTIASQTLSLSPSQQAAMARRRARRRPSLVSVCNRSCVEAQEFFQKSKGNVLDEKSDMEKPSMEDLLLVDGEEVLSLSDLAGHLSAQLTSAIDRGLFSPNAMFSPAGP